MLSEQASREGVREPLACKTPTVNGGFLRCLRASTVYRSGGCRSPRTRPSPSSVHRVISPFSRQAHIPLVQL